MFNGCWFDVVVTGVQNQDLKEKKIDWEADETVWYFDIKFIVPWSESKSSSFSGYTYIDIVFMLSAFCVADILVYYIYIFFQIFIIITKMFSYSWF